MNFNFAAGQLARVELGTLIAAAISEALLFLAVLTPSWQVAEDTDVGRSIASGLWIYCPGSSLQCWYIFSDDVVNYYERADVCRFLLFGDCRKKLLRTPYFFSWHYAVLTIMLIALALGVLALACLALGHFRPGYQRVTTAVFDSIVAFNILLVSIGLVVFVTNAEMLESRYLIGVKNTFEKHYGYSFFLACLSLLVMLFAIMLGIFLTTIVFFMPSSALMDNNPYKRPEPMPMMDDPLPGETTFDSMRFGGGGGGGVDYLPQQQAVDDYSTSKEVQMMQQLQQPPPRERPTIELFGNEDAPRYCHSPSVASSAMIPPTRIGTIGTQYPLMSSSSVVAHHYQTQYQNY